ncbi:hypothetical protein AAHA92_20102 [Salvia divinorum]|uniref:Uncharacterized protein n=1 Tax=Salvia divinorum TaxID=28513 RepID=A0ABD1GG46_SALDI
MVMEVVHEDMGEGSMQCTNHPYKNSASGGICAACLQEKLGKLVSSSFPVAIFPSSSSSSSSRSDFAAGEAAAVQPRQLAPSSAKASENGSSGECNYYSRRSRLPFVLTQKKKSKKDGGVAVGSSDSGSIVFKRSKSTATPRRGMHFLDENFSDDYSPHRRGFWSFLYMSKHSTVKKSEKDSNFTTVGSSSVNGGGSNGGGGGGGGGIRPREKKGEDFVVVDENGTPDQSAYDGKVSRSRSVGCGSRSFSGDFFERISTGFGDCTLRRVESQREGKPKAQSVDRINGQDCIKERVRCGGIFGGFMITSSSSSSSSSSYWISSSAEENSKAIASARQLSHGRSKSWGWALASPMRAFGSKPSSSSVKRDNSSKNVTPNLAAIPSLLAVSG